MLEIFTNSRKRGFTLIELLLVFAIIVLLVSVLLVYMGPSRKKSRDTRREADVRQIGLATEMYFDEEDRYVQEDNFADVVANGISTFLPFVPNDPSGGTSTYVWINNLGVSNEGRYCLYATLEIPSTVTYVCSSERGLNSSTAPPTLGFCCFD